MMKRKCALAFSTMEGLCGLALAACCPEAADIMRPQLGQIRDSHPSRSVACVIGPVSGSADGAWGTSGDGLAGEDDQAEGEVAGGDGTDASVLDVFRYRPQTADKVGG